MRSVWLRLGPIRQMLAAAEADLQPQLVGPWRQQVCALEAATGLWNVQPIAREQRGKKLFLARFQLRTEAPAVNIAPGGSTVGADLDPRC